MGRHPAHGGRPAARRTAARAGLGALAGGAAWLALAAGPVVAGAAADDCPNAAVRGQQAHAAKLPNCMAYERVTPNVKHGAYTNPELDVATDGSQVSFWTNTALPGSMTGVEQTMQARRGSDGWTLRFLHPGQSVRPAGLDDGSRRVRATDDLEWTLYTTPQPLDPGDRGLWFSTAARSFSYDLYRANPDGTTTWITAPAGGREEGSVGFNVPAVLGASPDFSRIVYQIDRNQNPAEGRVPGNNHLWLYADGRAPELVDRMPDGSPSPLTGVGGDSRYISADARTVVFVADGQATGQGHAYARLDVGTPDARTVQITASAAGTPCPGFPRYLGISADGNEVEFTCDAALTPDAPAGGGSYVRNLQTGTVRLGTLDLGPNNGWTRPEGTYRITTTGGVGDNVILTDLRTGDETCVSCPPPGVAQQPVNFGKNYNTSSMRNAVSPDGEVVFQTAMALVPEDRNGIDDVYMWKDGEHHLLTTGQSPTQSQVGAMSLDGSTITIATSSPLVPEDRDNGARDVYVLRRGGGFFREAEAEPCRTGCQGPAAPSAPALAPLSLTFPDGSNAEDEGSDPIALSGSRTVRGTSLKVRVRVPGAGRVRVSGNGLRATTRSLKSATSASLTVRLSARSQRLLRTRSSLRLKATVRYTPNSGETQTTRVNLTFRRATAKKQQGSSRRVATASNGKAAR